MSADNKQEFEQPLIQPGKKNVLKKLLLTFVVVMIVVAVLITGVTAYAWKQFTSFTHTAGITPEQLFQQVEQGLNSSVKQTNGSITTLVLGVDSLASRPGSPALTDTILLISITPKNSTISFLSLPRDLWSDDYKTRINALYYYGLERYPENPEQFPTEVLSELLDIDIHHTIIVSLDDLEEVISSIDGITINIPQGFTDTAFPRSDVDVTQVSDPTLLYETISFEQGKQHLTAEKALQYIRSRHSDDEFGTDISRSQRQQAVLESIANKVLSNEILANPKKLGQLFSVYNEKFARHISLSELVTILKFIGEYEPESFSVNTHTLSIFPDDPDGVIVNPPTRETQGEWIYEIRNLDSFRAEAQEKLGI